MSSLLLYCGNALLADGTPAGGIVESLDFNGARVIQKSMPLRADWITIFDRLNRSNSVEFSISTEQPSLAGSLLGAAKASDNIGPAPALVLQITESGATTTLTLAGAAWFRTRGAMKGRTARVSYSVEGGRIDVAVAGDGSTPFPLPVLRETLGIGDYGIDPLIIPAGTLGTVLAGELLVCRSLQCDGELDLNGGELCIIGDN
jgi:hypothetical protein